LRFLHPEHDAQVELALDDVFLVPGYWEGASRFEVDLTPPDLGGLGSHSVVTANMNAVTGKRMAETIARFGGLGVLPQDMDDEVVSRIVSQIRAADTAVDTALTVTGRATLRDVQGIVRKRAHGMVVVVDEQRRPVGIVTPADLRDRDQYTPVSAVMSSDMVTLPAGIGHREAFLRMEQARVKAAPVLDADGRLHGILTQRDALRASLLRPSLDAEGKLAVAAAIGISIEAAPRAKRLVEMGVHTIVIDTAHGHQRRMLETLAATRRLVGPGVPLVAGNVCTPEGTRALVEAGADVVKVNVGPGAMCTTRLQTGAGRPTFSAVRACAEEAARLGAHVWADGGVRHPRDIALYLAAGASRVMVGTMFTGTWESPGDVQTDEDGALYKVNMGMASARAVQDRIARLDPFERAKKALFEEGISSSRIYLRPGREGAGDLLLELLAGIRSSFTYAGARDWKELQDKAVIGVQTSSGYAEGKPHGAIRR
jgi:IMP dehydrogenase